MTNTGNIATHETIFYIGDFAANSYRYYETPA